MLPLPFRSDHRPPLCQFLLNIVSSLRLLGESLVGSMPPSSSSSVQTLLRINSHIFPFGNIANWSVLHILYASALHLCWMQTTAVRKCVSWPLHAHFDIHIKERLGKPVISQPSDSNGHVAGTKWWCVLQLCLWFARRLNGKDGSSSGGWVSS